VAASQRHSEINADTKRACTLIESNIISASRLPLETQAAEARHPGGERRKATASRAHERKPGNVVQPPCSNSSAFAQHVQRSSVCIFPSHPVIRRVWLSGPAWWLVELRHRLIERRREQTDVARHLIPGCPERDD
jgi:hypothetical protein